LSPALEMTLRRYPDKLFSRGFIITPFLIYQTVIRQKTSRSIPAAMIKKFYFTLERRHGNSGQNDCPSCFSRQSITLRQGRMNKP